MEASEEVRAAAHRIGEVFGVSLQVLRFRAPVVGVPDGDGEE
ncbi:suppressor of fused domain protein, partial [Rhodococcus hoagii]|nr:suppressor of fused domain protein [Prescottella equi]